MYMYILEVEDVFGEVYMYPHTHTWDGRMFSVLIHTLGWRYLHTQLRENCDVSSCCGLKCVLFIE